MQTNNKPLSANEIVMNILSTKGAFVSACWKSNPKPAAAFKGTLLEKHTSAVCRAGINFANLSSVKAGIASGERGEVQELPWGRWFVDSEGKNWFPHIIEHKESFYIRLYPVEGAKSESLYFVGGREVSKELFDSYLTPSDAAKSTQTLTCFTIKAENVLSTSAFGNPE